MSLKQNQRNGTKGNANYHKEELVTTHKRSKLKKTVINDNRVLEVTILLKHPRRTPIEGTKKNIEAFSLESEKRKWIRDGFTVEVI